jgi:hypothetical protein
MNRWIMAAAICLLLSPAGLSAADDLEAVGVVAATQGTVTMQPATMNSPVVVKPFDQVGPLVILETQPVSRCKILYTDDSLLTIGENSRLEVTEQTYRAGSNTRTFVAHLSRGSVRALVGRPFEGENSVFEIHAGTAVATARGTYFVLWNEARPALSGNVESREGRQAQAGTGTIEEGRSGVANIGQTGNVAFTSGGATVLVMPGQFSIAAPGAPPTMPVAINGGIVPVTSAVSGTVLTESPKPETPRAALAAVGLGRAAAVTSDPGPGTPKAGVTSPAGAAPSGSYMLPDWPFPVTPVTPPAVASGAVQPNTTIILQIQLP